MATAVINPVRADTEAARGERFVMVDWLRGVALLLMAFDHANLFARDNLVAESMDGIKPALASWPHVAMGLLTNIATSIFFTLAGVSVAFFERSRRRRGWTEWQISRFLMIRATILLLFDLFINPLSWREPACINALGAIAFCLVVIAFVRRLPLRWVAFISFALFLVYPLLVQTFPEGNDTPLTWLSTILLHHHRESPPFVEFPMLGRLSIVLLGYVFGRLLIEKRMVISYHVLWISVGGYALWLLIRLAGGYGNFLPYQIDWSPIYFLVQNKQPPSLVFLLWNLSGAVLALVVVNLFYQRFPENSTGKILGLIGRTPLFFYMAHLPIYSLLISSVVPVTFLSSFNTGRAIIEWLLGLLILIPLCWWYWHLKQRHPNSPLQYI